MLRTSGAAPLLGVRSLWGLRSYAAPSAQGRKLQRRMQRTNRAGRRATGHFHHPSSPEYQRLYHPRGATDAVAKAQQDLIAAQAAHRPVRALPAPSSKQRRAGAVVTDDADDGESFLQPARTPGLAEAAAAAAANIAVSAEMSAAAAAKATSAEDGEAAEIRRWVSQAPAVAFRRGAQRGVPLFGQQQASTRAPDMEEGRERSPEERQPPTVGVPLLPVQYLRQQSLATPSGNGERCGMLSGDADDDGATAVDKIHAQLQRNALRQVGRPTPFRCRRCFTVFTARPDDVLREGTARDPRGPSQGCPNCGSHKVQWVMDYVHRGTHTATERRKQHEKAALRPRKPRAY